MPESKSHKQAKRRAAGVSGETEVPIGDGRLLDAATKHRATEVERSGTPTRLLDAADRLADSGKSQKILQVPHQDMDAAAEAEIFARFREHSRDKMAILISHRFSTVRSADLILVIDQGHIIERGTHEELLAAEGRYAKLFHLQAAGYK